MLLQIAEGERLATMASLLHRDADGGSLVGGLIAPSDGSSTSWLRCFLHSYLRPVAHCLLAHAAPRAGRGRGVV